MKKNTVDYERYLTKKYKNLKRIPTIEIVDFLKEGINTIEPYCFLEGGSTLPDLLLLENIAASIPDCCYFEIGTWRGESISNVAKYANKCVSLSLSVEEQQKYGFPQGFINNHLILSRNLNNVVHIGHDSLSFDFTPFHKQFDLVFIDALHSYKAVKCDTINAMKLLRNDNSIIIWHDYGISTDKVNWEIYSAILDGMPPEEHKYLYHVSNTLCAIYIKQKYSGNIIDYPSFPNKVFSIKVNVNKFQHQ